jgi:hypothetical protein
MFANSLVIIIHYVLLCNLLSSFHNDVEVLYYLIDHCRNDPISYRHINRSSRRHAEPMIYLSIGSVGPHYTGDLIDSCICFIKKCLKTRSSH